MEETIPAIKTNKTAIISLVTAILAPSSYCVASVLLTTLMVDESSRSDVLNIGGYSVGIFLYAIAPFILGVTALVSGISALRKIKQSSERGKGLAITGIVLGGLVTTVCLCILLSIIGILLTTFLKTSL